MIFGIGSQWFLLTGCSPALPCSAIAVVWWQKSGKIRDTAVKSGICDFKDNLLKNFNSYP
jgi:hypothetical protein